MKLFGKSKAQTTKETATTPPTSIPENSWACKKCGAINSNGSLSCKDCGTYK